MTKLLSLDERLRCQPAWTVMLETIQQKQVSIDCPSLGTNFEYMQPHFLSTRKNAEILQILAQSIKSSQEQATSVEAIIENFGYIYERTLNASMSCMVQEVQFPY